MRFLIVSHFLLCFCVIQYSESATIIWYEPSPVVTTSDPTVVIDQVNLNLIEGSYASLSWNFSLTPDLLLISVTIRLNSVKFGIIVPSNGLAALEPPFQGVGRFNISWIPNKATLVIDNVTDAEDNGEFSCELSTFEGVVSRTWMRKILVHVVERSQIVDVTSDQDVCEETKVALSCNATGKPEPNITWTRVWENGTDSGALQSKDGYFVLDNISRSSNGIYRCTAFNGVGEPINHTVEVIVRYSVIRVVRSSNAVLEGDAYTMSCEATGDPKPNVTWIKVSNNQRGDGSILNFTSVNRNDSGNYTCEANNRCGTKAKTEAINVSFRPDNVTLERKITENNDCIGLRVNFTCHSSEANPPVYNYVLLRNETEVSFSKKGTWIEKISGGETFVYKCQVYQQVDNVTSTNDVTLAVNDPPTVEQVLNIIIEEGGDVTKECSVTAGTPSPTVFWKNINTSEVTYGKLLNITDIRRDQSGEYRCFANNTCGNDSSTMFIYVQYPPNITYIMNDKKVNDTDKVTLDCQADGYPLPTIRWIFVSNNSFMPGTFHITGKQDEGFYSCIADNGVGNPSTREVYITVLHYRPLNTTLIINTGDNFVIVNQAFNATCGAQANPPATYDIFRDNGTNVGSNSVVTMSVTEVEGNNAVTFTCKASNAYGDGPTVKITVQVYSPPKINSKTSCETFVEKGKPETLTCTSAGHPTPNITWTKLGIIHDSDGISLRITPEKTDRHSYECKADNGIGIPATRTFVVVLENKVANILNYTMTYRDQVFTKEMYNNESEEFQKIASDTQKVKKAFPQCSTPKVEVVRFGPGSVVAYFRLIFDQPIGEETSTLYLQQAAKAGVLGGVDADSIAALEFFPATKECDPLHVDDDICNEIPNESPCSCNDVILKAIIGSLVFIIVVLCLCIIWLCRKGTIVNQRKLAHESSAYDNEMASNDLEPSITTPSTFNQPRAEYMDLTEIRTDKSKTQSADQAAYYAALHPSTRSWEVERDHVTIEKIIGKGAFGQVAKGTATELRGKPEITTVAIKMLKLNAAESDKRDLMKELATMKQLKPHPHVIKLLGCVTESEPLLVLIEYVPFGDLLGYLRKSRGLNDTYYKDPDIKPQTNLTSQQLMKFAWQIADGMSYLSSKSIIHRDLAARNVLVGERETCKVTDFGMARDVQEENIYERKTKGRLPVKWTAYEALLYGTYTTKSDVWSYGIVLYEIFTIGGSPYPRMDGRKIANKLQEGYRMPKPKHVDEKLYQIMMKCWKNDPGARPTFTELKNQLKDMESMHKRLINMKMYDKQLYANVEDLIA